MTLEDRAKRLVGIETIHTDLTSFNKYNPGLIPVEVVHARALVLSELRAVQDDERCHWLHRGEFLAEEHRQLVAKIKAAQSE